MFLCPRGVALIPFACGICICTSSVINQCSSPWIRDVPYIFKNNIIYFSEIDEVDPCWNTDNVNRITLAFGASGSWQEKENGNHLDRDYNDKRMLCIPSTKHKASRKRLEGWVCVCVFHSVFPDKQEGCSLFCLFFLSYIGNHNFILPFLLSSSQSLFCCVSLGREFDNTDILIRMHLKAFSLVRTALCGINICIYICIHISLKSSTYVEALMCLTNRYAYTPWEHKYSLFSIQRLYSVLLFSTGMWDGMYLSHLSSNLVPLWRRSIWLLLLFASWMTFSFMQSMCSGWQFSHGQCQEPYAIIWPAFWAVLPGLCFWAVVFLLLFLVLDENQAQNQVLELSSSSTGGSSSFVQVCEYNAVSK